MSEQNVITEGYEQAPEGNLHDGSAQAYEESDAQETLEAALDEKAEVDSLKERAAELETQTEEESKPETEEEDQNSKFSSQFAALSRKEKALREREAQMQQQYEQKFSELEAKLAELQNNSQPEPETEAEIPLEYRLKKDPLGTLSELGLSYDKLTNLALNDGKLTPEMQMDLMRQDLDQKYSSELENLRNEILERDKKMEEEKYNETVNNFKTELVNFVNDNDNYELIRANDAADLVFDVIEEHYNETGSIMSKEEAANEVESYLEEEVEKLLKLNKLKAKLGVQQASQSAIESAQRQPTQKAPTLSNAHSATASKPSRPRTREESVAQAASLLKWNE